MSEEQTPPALKSKASPKRPDRWYWRLRKHLTPGLRNAQYAYLAALSETLGKGDDWLDIGCGRRIAPTWLSNGGRLESDLIGRAGRVVGVDPDASALSDNTLPMVKHHSTAERVAEPDAAFDLITANMVVEHLETPGAMLCEAERLLRPGGVVLLHTPNRWYPVTVMASAVPSKLRRRVTGWLEKRAACDIYPTHYRMNSPQAIRRLAHHAGLEVESVRLTADSPETVRLGLLVLPELAMITLTRTRMCRFLRSNLIVTLRKPMQLSASADDRNATRPVAQDGDRLTPDRHYGEAA
ncbi:MAG: class I SAM-dependent methyltransferase [Planctomycetota bacterium]